SLLGYSSLGWGGCRVAQLFEAFIERIQLERLPGLKQTRQAHANLCPLVAARAAADLADDHERANAALSQIVVGTQALHQHEREQLILMPQQPLGERTAEV